MVECPICLEEDAPFVSMPCKHEVCEVCLRKIMENSKECPMCRANLRQPEQIQVPRGSASCEKVGMVCFMLAFISLVIYGMAVHH